MEQVAQITKEQELCVQMYFKFLYDAANMIAGNPTPAAHQARVKIDEALFWGRTAIQSFQLPDPAPVMPQPTSDVALSEEAA